MILCIITHYATEHEGICSGDDAVILLVRVENPSVSLAQSRGSSPIDSVEILLKQ